MSIGLTTRYETWFFAAILFIMIVNHLYRSGNLKSKKIILLALIFIILSSFPLYWTYISYFNTHRVFGLADAVASNYLSNNNMRSIKDYVFYTFLEFNITSLNILGFISLFLLCKSSACIRQYAFLFFSTLILFAVISYQMNAMPNHNFWRLSMIWSAMLIPFTAHFLYNLYNTGQTSIIKSIFFVIVFAITIYLFLGQTLKISSSSYISADDIKVGNILQKAYIGNAYNTYVESNGSWDFSGIQVVSENPDRVLTKLSNYNNVKDTVFCVNNGLLAELKQRNITYLVLRSFTKISSEKVKVIPLVKLIFWDVYKVSY
jgi:hypothetical protein